MSTNFSRASSSIPGVTSSTFTQNSIIRGDSGSTFNNLSTITISVVVSLPPDENSNQRQRTGEMSIELLILLIIVGSVIIIGALYLFLRLRRESVFSCNKLEEFEAGIGIGNKREFVDYFNLPTRPSIAEPSSVAEFLALHLDPKFQIPRADITYELPSLAAVPHQKVFYGYFRTIRKRVAVNRIVSLSESNSKVILRKIKVMSAIGEHPNLVTFLGISATNMYNGELYIISELCEKGNLQNYLLANVAHEENPVHGRGCRHRRRREESEIQDEFSEQFHQWAKEIASAMVFLGTQNIVLIDLTTRNTFLTQELVAKIGDFGLAEKLCDSVPFLNDQMEALPFKFLAMECWLEMEFSVSSDVWAYGVTLWEIFSCGSVPYSKMTPKEILAFLKMGERLSCPEYASQIIYSKILSCWNIVPENRPSFEELELFFSYAKL